MIKALKQLLCRHDWKDDKENFIELPAPRVLSWKCSKCGKTRLKVIGG